MEFNEARISQCDITSCPEIGQQDRLCVFLNPNCTTEHNLSDIFFLCIYPFSVPLLETLWKQGVMLHSILSGNNQFASNTPVCLHIWLHKFLLQYNNCRNLNHFGCRNLCCIKYWKFVFMHSTLAFSFDSCMPESIVDFIL